MRIDETESPTRLEASVSRIFEHSRQPAVAFASALAIAVAGCGRSEASVNHPTAGDRHRAEVLTSAPTSPPAPPLARPDSVRIPILVYHSIAAHHPGQTKEQQLLDVDTAVFDAQMRYLADHGLRAVSLEDLSAALEGLTRVPAHAVVITFDDGWLNQYVHAFPVLRALHLTATFFIISGVVGDESYMSWDQLRELRDAGMSIGAHSRTHPKLDDPTASLKSEIEGSRSDLQRGLGRAPGFFAYPYGAWSARVEAEVRAAGYRGARALAGGPWNGLAGMYRLHAVLVTDDMQEFERAVDEATTAATPKQARQPAAGGA